MKNSPTVSSRRRVIRVNRRPEENGVLGYYSRVKAGRQQPARTHSLGTEVEPVNVSWSLAGHGPEAAVVHALPPSLRAERALSSPCLELSSDAPTGPRAEPSVLKLTGFLKSQISFLVGFYPSSDSDYV